MNNNDIKLDHLISAPLGKFLFDAHYGIPEAIRDFYSFSQVRVPAQFVLNILDGLDVTPSNKCAYKIAEDDQHIACAYVYDNTGYIFSITY